MKNQAFYSILRSLCAASSYSRPPVRGSLMLARTGLYGAPDPLVFTHCHHRPTERGDQTKLDHIRGPPHPPYRNVGGPPESACPQVDTHDIYLPGFYTMGLGENFIKFPTTQVTITFSDRKGVKADAPPIATRTGEDHGDVDSGGQAITLSVSLQYTLPRDKTLGKIYKDYGLQYHQRYTLVARNVISDVAQTFAPCKCCRLFSTLSVGHGIAWFADVCLLVCLPALL